MWNSLNNYRDGALLFLRISLGCFYIWIHGWSRLAGGLKGWGEAGKSMKFFGISFLPELWGFMGAFASTVGVLFIVLGLLFRPACLLIALTLTVVSLIGIETVGYSKTSHPIEMAFVVITLLFLGPGRYSFDKS